MSSYQIKYVRGQIDIDEYWASVKAEWDLSRVCENCVVSKKEVEDILTEIFYSLNGLDREHSFWNQSNKLPTFSKLYSYTQHLIEQNCNVVKAAKAQILLDLIHGLGGLSQDAWKVLHDNGCLNINVLVRLAFNQRYSSADLNINTLSYLIVSCGIQDNAIRELKRFKENNTKDKLIAKDWVNKVIEQVAQLTSS